MRGMEKKAIRGGAEFGRALPFNPNPAEVASIL
jgi:hypothetical protein